MKERRKASFNPIGNALGFSKDIIIPAKGDVIGEKPVVSDKMFSDREHDILSDLYNGLTQSEIAGKRNLSINTVRMNMKIIYEKLDVHKISDLVRIVAEQQLV